MSKIDEFFGEVISAYTSEQAEADGVLIKTDNPIINYVTRTVYSKCIEPFAVDGHWEQFAKSKEAYEKRLLGKLLASAVIEVKKLNRQDWFYSIEARGWKFFIAQNETGKYTLMFPEDY